jgi:hypothetical protein
MLDDDVLAEAVHDTGIRRLQAAYADAVNRRAWDEVAPLFVDGAPVRLDTRSGEVLRFEGGAAIASFIEGAVERFAFFEFVVLNAHVTFPDGPRAGTAACRLFMCELRTGREDGRLTTAFGLYHDRYRQDGGRWRFAERRYHSVARTAADLDVFPLPTHPGIDVPAWPA